LFFLTKKKPGAPEKRTDFPEYRKNQGRFFESPTSARILLTLMNQLKRENQALGLASLCIGGDQGKRWYWRMFLPDVLFSPERTCPSVFSSDTRFNATC
jgi:hypothetical protein